VEVIDTHWWAAPRTPIPPPDRVRALHQVLARYGAEAHGDFCEWVATRCGLFWEPWPPPRRRWRDIVRQARVEPSAVGQAMMRAARFQTVRGGRIIPLGGPHERRRPTPEIDRALGLLDRTLQDLARMTRYHCLAELLGAVTGGSDNTSHAAARVRKRLAKSPVADLDYEFARWLYEQEPATPCPVLAVGSGLGAGVSTAKQQYDPTPVINALRHRVDQWRGINNSSAWGVTPETARLLQHWRHHEFTGVRPFFCQIEAVETAIWLTEVAPNERQGRGFLEHLANANNDANPELMRLALKLATGAGKTTVMAMLVAWQTVNAVRRPQSKRFTRGFLVVTPGITIKDRLRVLYPNDPDSYYASRELVPGDMLDDVNRAKIVITNYHGFKRREQMELSKGGRALLQGRVGDDLDTLETEGQMLQRVMPEVMGLKNILVLNDEAHHCYREKPRDEDDDEDARRKCRRPVAD
jgi:type III restriction/modification enzyme restriction subunit